MSLQPPNQVVDQQIVPLIAKYIDLNQYRLLLFGSRAKDIANRGSDIDIAIDGPYPVNRSTLASLRQAIEELPTIYKIDLVDLNTVSPNFKTLALESAKIITHD